MIKTLLAFDYGTKNIGIASGTLLAAITSELPPIKARDGIPNWEELEKILKHYQPDLVLVGLPLNMDDSESELATRARKFANRIHGRFGVPIEMVDERLSTFEAKGEAFARGYSDDYKNNPVDSIAARLILESWLHNRSTPTNNRKE